jgi:hypothetical protein
VREVPGASNYFIAIDFATTKETYLDSTEITTSSPTVIIKNDNIILDYSHLHPTKNKSDIDKIKFFFESSVSENDTITLSNGQYLNEVTGDASTYDIGGTITFKNFDVNNMMIYAKKVSLDNPSTTYSVYDYRFFLSSLTWTSSSSTDSNLVESVNQIINMVPTTSNNSFIKSFGNILAGDVIELKINNTTYSFTIESYKSEQTGTIGEILNVREPISSTLLDNNYIGTDMFCRLKRRINRKESAQLDEKVMGAAYPMHEFETPAIPQTKKLVDAVENDTTSTPPPSRINFSPEQLARRVTTKENSPIGEAKKQHIMSGSPTIHVRVELDKSGNGVYSFKHKGSPKGKQRDTLIFEAGKTYKFVQSHKSNGIYGFTNKEHQLSIGNCSASGCEMDSLITRSNKESGTNGSYLYFGPVPSSTANLYTFHSGHEGMGGEILVTTKESENAIPQSVIENTNRAQLRKWVRDQKSLSRRTTTPATPATSPRRTTSRSSRTSRDGGSVSGY